MKVLVACEESQEVCKAFRKKGHEAYSCDLQDCSGGHPEWHINSDVLKILRGGCRFVTGDGIEHEITDRWDLVIAHPPCTYISNAGANSLYRPKGVINKDRLILGLKARAFFMTFWLYGWFGCGKICIENPMPSKVYEIPEKTQVVQPYEHGHPFSKKTYLWLFGLPKLVATDVIPKDDVRPYIVSGSYSKNHDPRYKGESRKGGSSRSRSKTFPGIANAMADQWG